MVDYNSIFQTMGKQAKVASQDLLRLDSEQKNKVLRTIATYLREQKTLILEANAKDMKNADGHIPQIMMDRLLLTSDRIEQMADGVAAVADLSDPVGVIQDSFTRPNGLVINKVAVPLGVIAIIYEARPNVTVDAAALCLKTSNAVILRGGKEAFLSNQAMIAIMREALRSEGINENAIQLVEVLDREAVSSLLNLRQYIDVVIPRGGAGLIKRIVEESSIPVIETGSGVCHVYVDKDANPELVVPIVINSKVQRPSVCNSTETLLIHKEIVSKVLPDLVQAFADNKVSLFGDQQSCTLVKPLDNSIVQAASEVSWATEYNDLIMNVKIVDSSEEAIQHINTFGTHHSECIITENSNTAKQFQQLVDAAAVYINASTRFTDGFEFGFGAEIGISTQKLHARGPMGLEALTSYKYLIQGEGQIR